MAESVRVVVQEQSQIAEARRIARSMALNMGFDENMGEKIAIVVTEACTNLLKHAGGGELLLRKTDDDSAACVNFEVLALDKGPGMTNLDRCLRDGFSTGGSPGQGLGAIIRLSMEADFYSEASYGVALLARWSLPCPKGKDAGTLNIGAVNVCKPGQEVCGDSWGVEHTKDGSTVMVADGLGHGPEAKTASQEAVRMLRNNPDVPPGELLERAHRALRSSRGAAVAVARIDRSTHTVIYAGIGNISARIYSGAQAVQHMISVNGTAGFQTQRIREFSYPWPDNGMLLLHSDGLSGKAGLEAHAGLALRDASLIAGVLYRDFSRHNDDSTAVVAKLA